MDLVAARDRRQLALDDVPNGKQSRVYLVAAERPSVPAAHRAAVAAGTATVAVPNWSFPQTPAGTAHLHRSQYSRRGAEPVFPADAVLAQASRMAPRLRQLTPQVIESLTYG